MRPERAAGADVPITWRGRRARAFVPTPLAVRELGLGNETVARTATAAAELGFGAAAIGDEAPALARLLLRTEGLASSAIEGIAAPAVDVVLAAAAPGDDDGAAGWVAANARTVEAAARDVDRPLTTARLCEWHASLMAGSGLPGGAVGALRDAQGWIGGTSPLDAALVTPPPDRVPGLVDDVVAYANRDDVDAVAQAAAVHAQFEVVHPFADGNGRLGRVLATWVLVRRLSLVTPPPVSLRIAADRDGYLAGLTCFRLGQHERWIRWFADVVTGAGRAQVALAAGVAAVHAQWRQRLAAPEHGRAPRRDALAWAVLGLYPRHLAVTARLVADELGRSVRAASTALDELVRVGILTEHVRRVSGTRGRPARYYVAPDVLSLVR